jgi:hypothetical protein
MTTLAHFAVGLRNLLGHFSGLGLSPARLAAMPDILLLAISSAVLVLLALATLVVALYARRRLPQPTSKAQQDLSRLAWNAEAARTVQQPTPPPIDDPQPPATQAPAMDDQRPATPLADELHQREGVVLPFRPLDAAHKSPAPTVASVDAPIIPQKPARTSDPSRAAVHYSMGVMYLTGEGMPQSDVEAARWFRLAAEDGHPDAQYDLGVMYATGQGVPLDQAEATRWFRLAADQDNADARYNLDIITASGNDRPDDSLPSHA